MDVRLHVNEVFADVAIDPDLLAARLRVHLERALADGHGELRPSPELDAGTTTRDEDAIAAAIVRRLHR